MQTAFLDAVNTSMKIGAVVAFVGAVVAWLLIEKIPPRAHVRESLEDRIEHDLVEAGDTGGAPQGEAALRQPARA